MKTKEVIVLAFLSRTTLAPLLLTYEKESMYLHIDPQGCALFGENNPEPFYRTTEPLLLAQGIMTDSKTVHMVVLKTSGELCYTLISGSGAPQTSLLAKLDVRSTRYRRLFLFPQGKMIHIFYGYAHQSIPDLWRIEHRFWDGASWRSVHLGEVVHPREPLYHVNLDSQGNIHLLTMTFQGRHSLLFTNRFNGTFHIWGSPTETLKISDEVVDMTAFMTSDNVQYLFWVTKNLKGQFELRSAQQTDALVLTSPWHPSPAPIKTFRSPWKGIGALEINGVLWLLAHTGEETLMQNDGMGWKLVSSHTPLHSPLQWVHKGGRNAHLTYWLESQTERRAPAYYRELGFNLKKRDVPSPITFQFPPVHVIPAPPPPVPAFYPEQISPNSYPLPQVSLPQNDVKSPNPSEMIKPETSSTPAPVEVVEKTVLEESRETKTLTDAEALIETELPKKFSEEIIMPQSSVENAKLEHLITTVAHLEEGNNNMSLILHSMLSKFDQILEAIAGNAFQAKQETALPELAETPLEELEPVKEAMANLEKETQSLSQVLRVMLNKQEENDSSLENLEVQISQLQEEQKDVKNKGGFWNKWIT